MVILDPDGFIGSVMAIEGIPDAIALLHGSDGCHRRIRCMSNHTCPRPVPLNHSGYVSPGYNGSPRVPSTDLEQMDYVFGTSARMRESADCLDMNRYGLIAVANSPGASLTATDTEKVLKGMDNPHMVLRSDLFSKSFGYGWDITLADVVSFISPQNTSTEPLSVNILGTETLCRGWEHSLSETGKILGRMGVRILSAPGAGSSTERISACADASLNVVMSEETGINLAQYCRDAFGTPFVVLKEEPIGDDAIREMYCTVADALGISPVPALIELEHTLDEIYGKLVSIKNMDKVRGRRFSIRGTRSIVEPLAKWLHGFFYMLPGSLKSSDGFSDGFLKFLDDRGLSECLDREPADGDMLFTDGVTAELWERTGRGRSVGIRYPLRDVDFIPRTLTGLDGLRFIADEVARGL